MSLRFLHLTAPNSSLAKLKHIFHSSLQTFVRVLLWSVVLKLLPVRFDGHKTIHNVTLHFTWTHPLTQSAAITHRTAAALQSRKNHHMKSTHSTSIQRHPSSCHANLILLQKVGSEILTHTHTLHHTTHHPLQGPQFRAAQGQTWIKSFAFF